MQKGFTSIIFIILVLLASVFIIGGSLIIKTTIIKPKMEATPASTPQSTIMPNPEKLKESILNNAYQQDEVKKDTVNNVKALMRQYYVQKASFPKTLAELKKVFNIDDAEIERYNKPPFYFNSDGSTYRYYVKLNNGEIFEGDTEGINKHLDAAVWVDVENIMTDVNLYYGITKSLPKDLAEISSLPDLSYFKLTKNPVTGKPYTYIPNNDGTFTVSGTLSNGTEYKLPRK